MVLKAGYITRQCDVENRSARCRLQTAWWMACFFCMLFILGGFSCLYVVWQPYSAFRWLLTATMVNAYVLWLLWTALEKNHSLHNADLQPALGVANWLTVGRGLLIGALGGFLFQELPGSVVGARWLIWLPGAMYIVAVLLDYLDGYVARVMRSESRLGEWLDTKIDALGLLVAPILAIGYDRLPVYYISVGLAYYLFQFGLWCRNQNNRPAIEIQAHPAKRMFAGFQMGLVGIALLPVFSRPAMTVAATIFMIPLLAGFLKDALLAGGYVMANTLQPARWDRNFDLLSTKWLPVFLRIIISLTAIYLSYEAVVRSATGDHNTAMAMLNPAMPYSLPVIPLIAAAGFMIAVGFMARTVALLISVFLAGTLTTWDSPFSLFLLLSCVLILTLTGSGRGSIWQPEDRLLLERRGRRPPRV